MFPSESEMQHHKEKDHEYCSYCNMDFELFEDHHQHRIDMDEGGRDDFHITCKHCGLNCKTRKARDDHVKRSHAVKQKLLCPICEDPMPFFDSVSFMKHIEEGRCPRIDPDKLKTAHIHKELVREILKDPDVLQGTFQASADDSDSEDGGVSLLDAQIEEPLLGTEGVLIPSRVDTTERPPVDQQSWPKTSELGVKTKNIKFTADVTRYLAHMEIGSSNHGKMPFNKPPGYWNSRPKEEKILVVNDNAKSLVRTPNAWGNPHIIKKLFPDAKPSERLANLPPTSPDNSTSILHHQFWNPKSPEYNPKMFFDPLRGIYTCPFPSCR
jgi:hypothetical protein